jgi:predicted metalloenzyme YecM
MPSPDPHNSLQLINHQTGHRLKIELIDLPFPGARSYRIRVNERCAQKVPAASKTMVAKQLRGWLVKH